MERTLAALEGWPVNVGLQACARSDDDGRARRAARRRRGRLQDPRGLRRLPGADRRDAALRRRARRRGRRSTPTGCTRSAELEDTVAAIAGRTVHAYHVEGTGGGHVPDLHRARARAERHLLVDDADPAVRASSAAAEHVPMTVLNHGGSLAVPDDVALVRERIHPATMAAEGPLHELGAIGIINSDSQGMGRIMETVRRTLQLAHVDEGVAGDRRRPGIRACPTTARPVDDNAARPALPRQGDDRAGDHPRHRRRTSARSRPGRLADIVLWKPACFGVKPELVLKAGLPAWAPLGEGNATVERAEPTRYRPDWARHGRTPRRGSASRSSSARRDAAALRRALGTRPRARRRSAGLRGLTRADLALEPGDGADRDRPGRRPGHARRPAARRRAGRRRAAQPALLPALRRAQPAFAAGGRPRSARARLSTVDPPSPRRSTTSRRPPRTGATISAARSRVGRRARPGRRSRTAVARARRPLASARSPRCAAIAVRDRRPAARIAVVAERPAHRALVRPRATTQIGIRGRWTGVGRNVIGPNR